MTAVLPAPTPAALAARLRLRAARPPGVLLPPPREVCDVPPFPAGPLADAATLARARFLDCSRGAHDFVAVPGRAAVCLHCPVPADQAAKVRAARTVAR